jgi:heme exporter protein C
VSPTIPGWWTVSGRALWALSVAGVLASVWAVLYLAPVEAQMGVVQKIVYVHVPSAIATYIAFAVTCAAGIAYLATRQWIWDAVAVASCEVGLVFATVVLVSGPLWARSAWNTWWTWEPRLTVFLIMWILYGGYHVLRHSVAASARRTLSAVLGIVLFPITFLVQVSVQLWHGSLHPKNVTMVGEMRATLLLSMAVWAVFYVAAFQQRLRLEWLREAADRREGRETAAAPDGATVSAGEGR